ncbi:MULTISPECIES: IclR family transcriptional regulator [Pseudonocardia]|uniref:Transcriptional regulator, IclR family n=1 Tax=Pseudonocardia oroxyli TaxID=366584 RepID=A0A1G7WIG3_PSEOR|nr:MULTISPECIES: IclR family transcriptional regulator [Pseudonocardia]MCF7547605.1 IclR family transcriptional regulator [Pseudonocardia sp. WMMC193]SDG71771.1 transcriptional regulator, IclR family [Pseudonocardia oroxyli]
MSEGAAAPGEGRDLQVLARVSGVLRMFSGERSLIDLPTATAELGLNRSTTYRYLAAMVKHGLLVHTTGQGYSLGPLLSRVGLLALDRLPLIERADPVMRELSETVHETSTLSVWGGSGPLVARVHDEQSRFIRISLAVGSTMPIGTAQGQLFLAHLSDDRALARATSAVPEAEREALLGRRAAIRKQGVAFSDAKADGLRCVAAPVYGVDGALAATLALVGTVNRMPETIDDGRVAALIQAARSLSSSAPA